jgi:hypothetical protein
VTLSTRSGCDADYPAWWARAAGVELPRGRRRSRLTRLAAEFEAVKSVLELFNALNELRE